MEIKVTTKDMPGLILLLAVIVMEVNISLQQHCLPTVSSQTGFALTGTEYRSFTTEDYPACLMECEKDMSCMSLNFLLTTRTCDLNTQTKESRPERYKERPHSIYLTNTAFRTPEPVKGMRAFPAKSCLDILVSGESVGTGVYWIDPPNTGTPIQAFCDMTTDGGGWTVVKKTVLQSLTPIPLKGFTTYDVIAAYDMNDVVVIPKGVAMLDILQKMGFHQIHFYCHKKSTGRVVSIRTKNNTAGQQVVRYFTDDTFSLSTYPEACGSFDRLPEDTSVLAQNCQKWGWDDNGFEVNKWASKVSRLASRLGRKPFTIEGNDQYLYGCGPLASKLFYCSCDDSQNAPYDVDDKWQIAVR